MVDLVTIDETNIPLGYVVVTVGGVKRLAQASTLIDAAGSATAGGLPTLPAGTDRSGTIATGGTAQQIAPANPARRVLTGQNLSNSDLWVNDLGVAAGPSAPSKRVTAGGTFKANYQNAVSIWGATTGQAYQADEG